MCSRYTLTPTIEALEERFAVSNEEFYRPRYNAAPSQLLPVVTMQEMDKISFYHWGSTPQWSKSKPISPKLFNALNADLQKKPSFKKALMRYRCIVPADGFYAWKKVSKKSVVPFRITRADKGIFSMPALFEAFENENEETVHTFTIITAPSVPALTQFEDTMPVLFNREQETEWLSPDSSEEKLMQLVTELPALSFDFYTVSPRINDVEKDVPSLIQPTAPADQFGNYSLFD